MISPAHVSTTLLPDNVTAYTSLDKQRHCDTARPQQKHAYRWNQCAAAASCVPSKVDTTSLDAQRTGRNKELRNERFRATNKKILLLLILPPQTPPSPHQAKQQESSGGTKKYQHQAAKCSGENKIPPTTKPQLQNFKKQATHHDNQAQAAPSVPPPEKKR